MAIGCSLCCCFSFLMENQGQRELKMIRHVYGVLVIHEVFQRIVWHTTFTLQHHSSGSDFWVSSFILAGTNVWPVTLELSKGKNDLHFQTMDKYCDDLLWLESLIDGWGQTLTLITEKNHIIARITDQILITSFLQLNVALMVSCTPSNNICCALFRLTFFWIDPKIASHDDTFDPEILWRVFKLNRPDWLKIFNAVCCEVSPLAHLGPQEAAAAQPCLPTEEWTAQVITDPLSFPLDTGWFL